MKKLMTLASGILLLRLLDVLRFFEVNCFTSFSFFRLLRRALKRFAAFFAPHLFKCGFIFQGDHRQEN